MHILRKDSPMEEICPDGSTKKGKQAGPEKVKLKKQITLLNSCTIIVGSIIGSGIFVSPKGVLDGAGSPGLSLIIWGLSGILSTLGALCSAEMGTMITRSGGDYIYCHVVGGPFLGFLRLWMEVMIVRPVGVAIIALTFGTYAIKPFFSTCQEPELMSILLGACAIVTVCAINCFSVRMATLVQDIFSYAKVFALAMIIGTGIYQLAIGYTELYATPFEDSNYNVGQISSAFYSGLFAYSGWNYLNCVIEEMINPKRDLPYSIVISLTIVTIVYTLTNAAYFTTVTPWELMASPAVAVTFADRLYGVFWWIIPLFVAMSTFGCINGSLFSCARIIYVAGEEDQLPYIISTVQITRKTPLPAVLFETILSLAYLLVGDIYVLINYTGFVEWLGVSFTVIILVYLKFNPLFVNGVQVKPAINVPLVVPLIYITAIAFLSTFSFVGNPKESIMGSLMTAVALPVYAIFIFWDKKPQKLHSLIDGVYKVMQKIFLVVSEEKYD